MKKLLIFILLVSIIQITQAQENVILRSNGHIEKNGEVIKSANGKGIKPVSKEVNDRINNLISKENPLFFEDDTLFYQFNDSLSASYGIYGQDWMIQWFVAPADMTIKAAGYNCVDSEKSGLQAELKIVKLAWTEDELIAASYSNTNLGYYEAEGNGFNNITAFQDNPDITGTWVSKDSSALTSPFGEDLWSDNGLGASIIPIPSVKINEWDFVQTDVLGFEPSVLMGTIIGVAVKNSSPVFNGNRIGMLADISAGSRGFKFYANGKTPGDPTTFGWWPTALTWDFALAVQFPSDPPPNYFHNITKVLWDVLTTAKTVSVDIQFPEPNPQNYSVILNYSVDGGNYIETPMSVTAGNNYQGTIPGQSYGTKVTYKISLTGSNTQTYYSDSYTYGIFAPAHTVLAIWHNYSQTRFEQLFPFYSQGVMGDWDNFNYNEVSVDLLSAYTTVIEIGGERGFVFDNKEAVKEWLTQGDKNYMVIGDEFLGYMNNWKDSTYLPGDFEYEVLGLTQSYNNIHNNVGVGTSIVYPIRGTTLADSLYDFLETLGVDTLTYDPQKTYGLSENWLAGFEIRNDLTNAEIFMKGIGDDSLEYKIGISHTTDGDKVVFMSFDPLSLQGIRNTDGDTLWIGNSTKTPFQQTYSSGFFFSPDAVEKDNSIIPNSFVLEQNYPNPFNPETTIKFSIPVSENVILKIYDVLGKEVKTLINENLDAGSYTTSFNGNELASGIYIYRLTAGSFTDSKKMLLLK